MNEAENERGRRGPYELWAPPHTGKGFCSSPMRTHTHTTYMHTPHIPPHTTDTLHTHTHTSHTSTHTTDTHTHSHRPIYHTHTHTHNTHIHTHHTFLLTTHTHIHTTTPPYTLYSCHTTDTHTHNHSRPPTYTQSTVAQNSPFLSLSTQSDETLSKSSQLSAKREIKILFSTVLESELKEIDGFQLFT